MYCHSDVNCTLLCLHECAMMLHHIQIYVSRAMKSARVLHFMHKTRRIQQSMKHLLSADAESDSS